MRQVAQLVQAVEEEEKLGLQRVTVLILIKAREERVGLGPFKQELGVQMIAQAPGKTRLANADGAFDNDVAR